MLGVTNSFIVLLDKYEVRNYCEGGIKYWCKKLRAREREKGCFQW